MEIKQTKLALLNGTLKHPDAGYTASSRTKHTHASEATALTKTRSWPNVPTTNLRDPSETACQMSPPSTVRIRIRNHFPVVPTTGSWWPHSRKILVFGRLHQDQIGTHSIHSRTIQDHTSGTNGQVFSVSSTRGQRSAFGLRDVSLKHSPIDTHACEQPTVPRYNLTASEEAN